MYDLLQLVNESWHFILYCNPQNIAIYIKVGMCESITHAFDFAPSDLGILRLKIDSDIIGGFTNDLNCPCNSKLPQIITLECRAP